MVKRLAAAAALAALGLGVGEAAANEKAFHGFYGGLDLGYNNVIAGADINGVDTLSQESKWSVGALAGARMQFDSGFVIGVEAGAAWEDGDLDLVQPGLAIDYRNDFRWRYGGIMGVALGEQRDTLVFAYGFEQNRDFDVTIRQGGVTFTQHDEQGLWTLGLGVERAFGERLSVRGMVGTSRPDFGERQLNMRPETVIDFNIGALWRF